MNLIGEIYNLIFYQPISQVLAFLYRKMNDFGLAVILLTFFIRLILFPLDLKTHREKEKFLKIQKEIDKMKEKINREEAQKEILNLYQKEKINPFFAIFSFLIQLPILITLYRVFLTKTKEFNPISFKIFNLSQSNLILTLLVIVFQLIYFGKKTESVFEERMKLFSTALIFLVLINLPSVISLYLLTSYLFLIFEKKFLIYPKS